MSGGNKPDLAEFNLQAICVDVDPAPVEQLSSSLSHAYRILDAILSGQKPRMDVANSEDAWIIELFRNMEEEEVLAENWDQFVISPGQSLEPGSMAHGVTSMSVFCAPMLEKAREWDAVLPTHNIRNFHVLGLDPAFRIYGQDVDQAAVADSFVLPEGDFDAFFQFLKLMQHNAEHFPQVRPVVVDNRQGFWNSLKLQSSTKEWSRLGVNFVENDLNEAVEFLQKSESAINLHLDPLMVEHPFAFKGKNPLLLLGTGNPKKVSDFRTLRREYAPLLECIPFQTLLGSFHEPDEISRTYFGNALEKMGAMLDVVYHSDKSYQAIKNRFPDRDVVLVANDTGARLRLVDKDGEEVDVDWINCPELQKAREFIAENKERWYPGPEIKMVASAMGKSTAFYSTVLKAIRDRISEETGKDLEYRYIDDSVFLYAVLGQTRDDVKMMATKGMHEDGMQFYPTPAHGDIDFENFAVPLHDNPENRSRADLGHDALLNNSSTELGVVSFLRLAKFPEPLRMGQAFDAQKGNVVKFKQLKYSLGTIGNFARGPSYGFQDFSRMAHQHSFRGRGKSDLADIKGFENYLSSVDGLILGGIEGVDLSPQQRAVFYARVMVAIQTNHPSLSGKPVVLVDNDKTDPVLRWVLKTQNFLYNHKLFGMRTEECFRTVPDLKSALVEARQVLSRYKEPISFTHQFSQDGDDFSGRPTVSLYASAGTYDPQHIEMGERFAEGLAERDLHFRHGGCSRGVVGGAADSFAAYRDQHGKGYMTGMQCYDLLRLEGINDGNDCVKIHENIGGRKLDIFQSDIAVFQAGGWGTVEEIQDLFLMMDVGEVSPERLIFVDYPFDAAPDESVFQHIREFLTPEMIERYKISFVKDEKEALKLVDDMLPVLWQKYKLANDTKVGSDPKGMSCKIA